MNWFADKVKMIAAGIGAIVTAVSFAIADKSVDFDEAQNVWAAVVGLLATMGLTYFAPRNKGA